MEEKKLTDEATIDSLKEMAIKFSKDTYVNRVLVNAINLIHRLQDENAELLEKNEKLYELGLNENTARFEDMKKIERLEDEVQRLAKVKMGHIGMIADKSAEIERLTEENEKVCVRKNEVLFRNLELKKQVEAWKEREKELETAWDISSTNEEKLQKQVDGLKEERENIQKILDELGKCGNDKERYAVWVKLIKYCGV